MKKSEGIFITLPGELNWLETIFMISSGVYLCFTIVSFVYYIFVLDYMEKRSYEKETFVEQKLVLKVVHKTWVIFLFISGIVWTSTSFYLGLRNEFLQPESTVFFFFIRFVFNHFLGQALFMSLINSQLVLFWAKTTGRNTLKHIQLVPLFLLPSFLFIFLGTTVQPVYVLFIRIDDVFSKTYRNSFFWLCSEMFLLLFSGIIFIIFSVLNMKIFEDFLYFKKLFSIGCLFYSICVFSFISFIFESKQLFYLRIFYIVFVCLFICFSCLEVLHFYLKKVYFVSERKKEEVYSFEEENKKELLPLFESKDVLLSEMENDIDTKKECFYLKHETDFPFLKKKNHEIIDLEQLEIRPRREGKPDCTELEVFYRKHRETPFISIKEKDVFERIEEIKRRKNVLFEEN